MLILYDHIHTYEYLYVLSRFTRFIWGYYDEGNIYSLEFYPYKHVRIDWTSTAPPIKLI